MVHAVLSILLSGYALYIEGYNRDGINTKLQLLVFCHSLGYFSYDTVMETLLDTMSTYIMVHHVTACISLFTMICLPYGGSCGTLVLFLSELSTPLYIWKAMYDREGEPRNSFRYQILLWVYSFIFFISRAVLQQILSYDIAHSTVVPMFHKILLMLNLFVFHYLLTSLVRLLWKSIPNWYARPKQVESQQWWITGKNLLNNVTRDTAWKKVYYAGLAIHTIILPLGYNFYVTAV